MQTATGALILAIVTPNEPQPSHRSGPTSDSTAAAGAWRERQRLEAAERLNLAAYAEHAASSRGRRYPSQPHPYRTCFQVDRDRIMYTTAFRRLQYKTQVFVFHEGDYYRSRLTHTNEAAQIARTIARALGANEDLSEAITLAHDLGHPPFGHTGERMLDELVLTRLGLDPRATDHRGHGFNHTLQSLRIVEVLEHRWPDHPGLNLCWETREGIVKHNTPYDAVPTEWATEYEPRSQPSLEAQIVNAADQLAYSAHDLDDGLRSGLLRLDMSELANLELWRVAAQDVPETEPELRRHRVVRRLTDLLISDLVYATAANIEAAGPRSKDDIRKQPQPLVAFSPAVAQHHAALTRFLNEHLYEHARVRRMFRRVAQVLSELFAVFEARPELLPEPYRPAGAGHARDSSGPSAQPAALQAIVDYIAGMTDRYALQQHRELCGARRRG